MLNGNDFTFSFIQIIRSHGSVTSVVRATSEWEKAKLVTPLTTPTPLNRQSPNIAQVITHDYVVSICPHATFGQDRARVTSPM